MHGELRKATLTDMPHYSRFLFLQRGGGSKAQGTVGQVELDASFILSLRHHWTLTPQGCREILWIHMRGCRGILQNTWDHLFYSQALLALRIQHSCSSASSTSVPASLAPPASFFQPHSPRSSSQSATVWGCLTQGWVFARRKGTTSHFLFHKSQASPDVSRWIVAVCHMQQGLNRKRSA